MSRGINQEDKGSDLPWPELQCHVDRRITRAFLNLPFPQYGRLGGAVRQPEGGGAVCSEEVLRHGHEAGRRCSLPGSVSDSYSTLKR